jgi:hypothetical protein
VRNVQYKVLPRLGDLQCLLLANCLAKIIIVINNRANVSRFEGQVPSCETQQCRKIRRGPIYDKDEVILLCEARKIQLWTKGAIVDTQKWELDTDDIAEMIIYAMRRGRFRCSEWCIQKADGPWAACDVYTFTWSKLNRFGAIGYYLKFAISKTGQMLLTVSIHPEGT